MKKFFINEQIQQMQIGNPIPTDAVVLENRQLIKDAMIEPFYVDVQEEIHITTDLRPRDIIYGLGENMRGINKKGYIYESFCSDDPNHSPDKRSLYGAHNFFIIDGAETKGVFIDFAGKITFDMGYNNKSELKVKIHGDAASIYFIDGNTKKDIVSAFLQLIGRSYIPPKWAFGYIQSRWGYETGQEIEDIAKELIERDIPCDGICLDLDYMDNFKDFTTNEVLFPQFKEFTQRLKEQGIKLIPIIDAGVKIEKDYEIYEEGIKHDYFVKTEDGNPFVGAVWPGKVHFPDFLNPKARKWFGSKYKKLVDMGIEGFWNDMNEPAIFYSEEGIARAFAEIDELKEQELNIHSFFKLKDSVNHVSNSMEDYGAFYHEMPQGRVNHMDVHNLYGYNMTRAASEGFEGIAPNKRVLLFSRASAIGAHRYGGIWTGDNASWWEHLKLNIQMMPSLSMCGFLFSGADTCGFGSNIDSELAVRWHQFSIFTPLLRNHSAIGTRNQEPFAFEDDTEHMLREAIKFRYAMIPYIYSEFMKAVLNYKMYAMPLSFEYDDPQCKQVEDQLLIGESIMVAPISEPNKRGRYVYLPEAMLLVRCKGVDSRVYKVLEEGHHYIEVDLDEWIFFVRKNKTFVLTEPQQHTEKLNCETLETITFLKDEAIYRWYDDDGITKTYNNQIDQGCEIKVEIVSGETDIIISDCKHPELKNINTTVVLTNGEVIQKKIRLKN